MKTTVIILLTLTLAIVTPTHAQDLTLDFDTSRTGYGIEETSGIDTALSIAINGTPTAADNFDELDNLPSATVAASGSELGSFSPFTFTIAASAGDVLDVQGDGIDVSGAGIDPGETITLNFGVDVILNELDFESIGPGEFAQVSIGGTLFTYGDSAGDSHSISQALSAGSPLIFQYADSNPASYNLQGISLSIIPEPRAYAVIAAVISLLFAIWRKRSL